MIKAISIEGFNPSIHVMEKAYTRQSDNEMELEWQLIQRCVHQPALFRGLYDKYYDNVFKFIFRRTNDMELTGDLCSQTFLKAMQSLSNYRFQGVPYSSFLFRIATNEVAGYFRIQQKTRTISLESSACAGLCEEIEDSIYDEHKPFLTKALSGLKEADMQIVEMRFFDKKSFKEIADILDITENNAKVKTYRILDKLKTLMK